MSPLSDAEMDDRTQHGGDHDGRGGRGSPMSEQRPTLLNGSMDDDSHSSSVVESGTDGGATHRSVGGHRFSSPPREQGEDGLFRTDALAREGRGGSPVGHLVEEEDGYCGAGKEGEVRRGGGEGEDEEDCAVREDWAAVHQDARSDLSHDEESAPANIGADADGVEMPCQSDRSPPRQPNGKHPRDTLGGSGGNGGGEGLLPRGSDAAIRDDGEMQPCRGRDRFSNREEGVELHQEDAAGSAGDAFHRGSNTFSGDEDEGAPLLQGGIDGRFDGTSPHFAPSGRLSTTGSSLFSRGGAIAGRGENSSIVRADTNTSVAERGGGRDAADGGDDEGGEEDDGVEERAQKRQREQRQEYSQKLVLDGFRAIADSYMSANRAIRGVESEQRYMIEAETQIRDDLVQFGVRVREATQLMQRQIHAAFVGDETEETPAALDPAGSPSNVQPGNVGGSDKAAYDRSRRFASSSGADTTCTDDYGVRYSQGDGSSGPIHQQRNTATTENTRGVGGDSAIEAARDGKGRRPTQAGGGGTAKSGVNGANFLARDGQAGVQEEEVVGGTIELASEDAERSNEENENQRSRRPLARGVGGNGGIKNGGIPVGGLSAVKRPRWNMSSRGRDVTAGPSSLGVVNGALTPANYPRHEQGASSSVSFRSQGEALVGWNEQ